MTNAANWTKEEAQNYINSLSKKEKNSLSTYVTARTINSTFVQFVDDTYTGKEKVDYILIAIQRWERKWLNNHLKSHN